MKLLKSFRVIRQLIFCILIFSIWSCRTKENTPLSLKHYTHKDIGNLPDSCYTIEVGPMTGWNPDIPEIEYYEKTWRNLFYYKYDKGIITFQGVKTIINNTLVIEKIKKIDGKFKAFYIKWNKYSSPDNRHHSRHEPIDRNYFTDTTTIGTNLSKSEVKNLLPDFRGKIHSELRDSLLFRFNFTLPIKEMLKINYEGDK